MMDKSHTPTSNSHFQSEETRVAANQSNKLTHAKNHGLTTNQKPIDDGSELKTQQKNLQTQPHFDKGEEPEFSYPENENMQELRVGANGVRALTPDQESEAQTQQGVRDTPGIRSLASHQLDNDSSRGVYRTGTHQDRSVEKSPSGNLPQSHLANLRSMKNKKSEMGDQPEIQKRPRAISDVQEQSFFESVKIPQDGRMVTEEIPFREKSVEASNSAFKKLGVEKKPSRDLKSNIDPSQQKFKTRSSMLLTQNTGDQPLGQDPSAPPKPDFSALQQLQEEEKNSRMPQYMQPTDSFRKKDNSEMRGQNQDNVEKPSRYLNQATMRKASPNQKKQFASQYSDKRSNSRVKSMKVTIDQDLSARITKKSLIPYQPKRYEEMTISRSMKEHRSPTNNINSPESIRSASFLNRDKMPSEMSQRELKPTKVLSGGPTNMEQRASRHQQRAKDRDTLQDSILKSSMTGGSVMTSPGRRTYSGFKQGIGRLEPFQCPKIVLAYEKPERNKKNLEILKQKTMIEINRTVFGLDEVDQNLLEDQQDLKISHDNIEDLMYALDYLPYLRNRDDYIVESVVSGPKSEILNEVGSAEALLQNLKYYLDPTQQGSIFKVHFYQIISMLMVNITKMKDSELAAVLASYYNKWLHDRLEVDLTGDTPQVEDVGENNDQEADGEPKAKKIYQTFHSHKKGVSQLNIDLDDSKEPSETSLVSSYVQSQFSTPVMKLTKLVNAYRHDHGKRFAFIKQKEASQVWTDEVAEKTNKRTRSIIPTDSRKYRPNILNEVLAQHTFSPKIPTKTINFAIKKQKRMIEQHLNTEPDAQGDDFHTAPENALEEIKEVGKISFENKYQLMLLQNKTKEKRIQELKKQQDEKRVKCSFSPSLLSSSKKYNQASNSRYFSPPPMLRGKHGGDLLSDVHSSQGGPSTARGYAETLPERIQSRWLKNELARKKEIEEAELTFKPKLVSQQLKSPRGIQSTPISVEVSHVIPRSNNFSPMSRIPEDGDKPRGFDKIVQRYKKVQMEKEEMKAKYEKVMKGERYDKGKLSKLKPPSFLVRDLEVRGQKKNMILCIDIQITPSRSGKITLRPNDKPEEVAEAFCQKHTLGKEMENTLVQQLEEHRKKHFRKEDVAPETPSAFPSSKVQKETKQVRKILSPAVKRTKIEDLKPVRKSLALSPASKQRRHPTEPSQIGEEVKAVAEKTDKWMKKLESLGRQPKLDQNQNTKSSKNMNKKKNLFTSTKSQPQQAMSGTAPKAKKKPTKQANHGSPFASQLQGQKKQPNFGKHAGSEDPSEYQDDVDEKLPKMQMSPRSGGNDYDEQSSPMHMNSKSISKINIEEEDVIDPQNQLEVNYIERSLNITGVPSSLHNTMGNLNTNQSAITKKSQVDTSESP